MSFTAILCVIFGHCGSGALMPIVTQWHVPWFFMLSGMFLWYSLNRHPIKDVTFSKFKGLVIPYFLWCGVEGMLVWVMSGKSTNLTHWFGLNTPYPFGNPHLWYLHCLIIFTGIVVWIWCLLWFTKVRYLLTSVLSMVAFVVCEKSGISSLYGTPSSPFYFLLGFGMAPLLLTCRCRYRIGHLLVSFCIVLSGAIFFRVIWFVVDLQGTLEQILRALCVISQIAAIWLGFDCLVMMVERLGGHIVIPHFVKDVFFVYCFHGLVLRVIGDICSASHFSIGLLGSFFFVTFSSLLVASLLRRCVPIVYALFSGGR